MLLDNAPLIRNDIQSRYQAPLSHDTQCSQTSAFFVILYIETKMFRVVENLVTKLMEMKQNCYFSLDTKLCNGQI